MGKLKDFVNAIPEKLFMNFGINSEGITFEAVENLESSVKASHIIITATPSRIPIIKKEWIQKGTHISCIGADMAGKQEIDSKIMLNARIFTDDKKQCIQAGEIEIPIKNGIISEKDIIGDIGDLLLDKVQGRRNEEEITVFDATGMALLDIATGKIALQLAEEQGLGVKVEI